jgi:hypothetical protein
MDVYGKINKPFWDDKPVAVIGGGPSMHDFDFEKLRGAHVLAVKDLILDIPWADAGFGLGMWHDKLVNVPSRIYWAVPEDQAIGPPPPAKNITLLKQMPGLQVSDDPGAVYGNTCEFGAMQICIHKRAKQIVLFGFDHEGPNWTKPAEHFSVYVPYLTAHGISVVNACPSSAIRCFQKVALQDAVAICANGKGP